MKSVKEPVLWRCAIAPVYLSSFVEITGRILLMQSFISPDATRMIRAYQGNGGCLMNLKERMLTLRLLQKTAEWPAYANSLGLEAVLIKKNAEDKRCQHNLLVEGT